jgi:putative ABC transport system permease protein
METIIVALRSLAANKLRSALTVLGIIVGIFSIISISTVISMLQGSIEEGLSGLGQNTFQIQKWPRVRTSGDRSEWAKIRNRKEITLENYFNLKDKLTEAKSVGAEMWQGGRTFKYRSAETNPNVSVAGVTPEAFPNNDWNVAKGRSINYNDVDRYALVVVLGTDIANKLFEFVDPVGQKVWMNGKKLRVIGVLEDQGQFFGQSQGNKAIIPITTFQSFYGKRSRSINITVMSYDKESYNNLIQRAEGHMRLVRKVPPGEDNDFDIWSNESVIDQMNDITASVRIGAFIIAGIALLAAGVGIMNIMLVSVTERTKEIGIRKAVGAKKTTILYQFLTEAILLCQLGGIIGIVLGILVGNLAGSMLEATAAVPIDWIVIGVLLCVIIGVTFGTYPAAKAANLDPIEALRYE